MEGNGIGFSGGGSAPSTSSGPAMGSGMNTASGAFMGQEMPNHNAEFSSKGLSLFKDIGQGKSNPMADLDHGRGKNSSFAQSDSLRSDSKLIDISNPIREEPQGFHPDFLDNKTFDSQTDKQINIQGGKEEKSMFKDLGNLQSKGFFDISKPVFSEKDLPVYNASKDTSLNKRADINEVKTQDLSFETSKNHDKVAGGKDEATYASIQPEEHAKINEFQPNIKGSHVLQPGTEIYLQEKNEMKSETRVETQNLADIKAKPGIKTDVETQMQFVSKVEVQTLTQVDTAIAQTLIVPEVMQDSKISLLQARKALAQVIAQEEIAKSTKTDVLLEEKGQTKIEKKAKLTTIEEKVKAIYDKRKEEVYRNRTQKPNKVPKQEFLFIEKDKSANSYRELAALLAAQKLKSTGVKVTGQTITESISAGIENNGASEIVAGLQEDQSIHDFVTAVSAIGEVTDQWSLHRMLRQITEKYTAIKLSFNAQNTAEKKDAERVYGKNLDEVAANVEEDHSTGELVETEDGQVVYVDYSKTKGYSVEPSEVSPAY